MLSPCKTWLLSGWLVPAGVSLSLHAVVVSLLALVSIGEADASLPAPPISTLADGDIEQEIEVTEVVAGDSGPGPDHRRIAELLRDLGGPDSEARERARLELQGGGECRKGLGQGGRAVNGLVLCLTASTDRVRPGDKITFTTWVCNLKDEDLTVEVGYTTCGNYLTGGTALKGNIAGVPMKEDYFNGACGTGAHPLYQVIAARSAVRYDCDITVGTGWAARRSGPLVGYHCGPMRCLEAPPGGIHGFQVSLTAEPVDPDTPIPGKVCSKGVKRTYWAGTVRSNEVQILSSR